MGVTLGLRFGCGGGIPAIKERPAHGNASTCDAAGQQKELVLNKLLFLIVSNKDMNRDMTKVGQFYALITKVGQI